MGSVSTNEPFQPKRLADALDALSGILTQDTRHTLTAKKEARKKVVLTRTTVKEVQGKGPLTIAEMKKELFGLNPASPKRPTQVTTAQKKRWNSSVKVENKFKSHTADGQMKNNTVRKVLNFQPKSIPAPKPRLTVASATPKFTKPEIIPKKSNLLQAKNTVRISGVFNLPETPVINNTMNKKCTIVTNKENFAPAPAPVNINLKQQATPLIAKKILKHVVPDTPLSYMSWTSDNDASFLQKEKDTENFEHNIQRITEEATLENLAEVSPPVSTPFKEYRNVQEFFNHTDETDNSALYNDNTIMTFDQVSERKESSKREDCLIVSLCCDINKVSITNDYTNTHLEDLLKLEKQLEANIRNVDNFRESQVSLLTHVRKQIDEKKSQNTLDTKNNNSSLKAIESTPKAFNESPVTSRRCSVIISPSYKTQLRNSSLRKKILYKPKPNVSEGMQTPNKVMDKRALNMYMEMKMTEQMNFLRTPSVKQRSEIPDTPSVTSHNLQMQLDKIYKDNS